MDPLVTVTGYQLTVIGVSLLLAPLWIAAVSRYNRERAAGLSPLARAE